MARRAGAGKMLDAPGAGRGDRARHAQRNRRRPALDDLLRLLGDTGESQEIHSRVENEFPSLSIRLCGGGTSSPPVFESQPFSRAGCEAIVAANTATDIHCLLPAIDAARLAHSFAQFATLADIRIDADLKK